MVSFRSRDHDRREPDGRQYFSGGNEDSKFIREVAERVYFCFDLMLMLRAMMDECPRPRSMGPLSLSSRRDRRGR